MSLNLKLLKGISYLRKVNRSSACPCRSYYFKRYLSSSCPAENQTESLKQAQEDFDGDVDPRSRIKRNFVSPEKSKLLRVSIIGLPNAGKSTVINALTNYDVCPVSRRPHTTRKNQKAIYLDDKTQLVFVDTPGLVSVKEIKKFSFKEEFVYGPEKSFGLSHVIAVMHDISNRRTREKLDFRIKATLQKYPDKKSILIINKVDLLKKKGELLEAVKFLTCGVVGGKPLPIVTFQEKKKQSHLRLDTEKILKDAKIRSEMQKIEEKANKGEPIVDDLASKLFTPDEVKKGMHQLGWPNFHDVFMVSALEGDGIDLLRKYFLVNAVDDDWLFKSDTLTDVEPQKLALQILQAKLLDYLPQEIPWKVKPILEHWDDNEKGELCIRIKIGCLKEKHQYRILGTNGVVLKRITDETEDILSRLLSRNVKLVIEPFLDKRLIQSEKDKS